MKRRLVLCAGWIVALVLLGVVLYGLAARLIGLRWNGTSSIPRGFYVLTSEPVRPGVFVWACPPLAEPFLEARARGYINGDACPGGMTALMKRCEAVKGDQVEFSDDAVRVNGRALPASRWVAKDPAGRPMPRPASARVTLGDEMLLMGDRRPGSYDARYFGPVPASQVQAVIRPVLTF